MTSEAIILAGGLGTRLRSEVSELPKSMAPINGEPFLKYQLNYLAQFKIKTIYLAVGYLSETIISYFGDSYLGMDIKYIQEEKPLGTGGAILHSLKHTKTEEVLILNGDTMFQIDLIEFYQSHKNSAADFSLALKPLTNFERYGVVKLNDTNQVVGFEEKQYQKEGLINGGVYILNKSVLHSYSFPLKFSFEKEFLESKYTDLIFNGYSSHNYFLDIGIPTDYDQAQEDFKHFENWNLDNSWTLFLDRDGVINEKIENGYVTSVEQFKFIDGSLEAIAGFNKIFGRIVIVTNQQCIGKNIISHSELNAIHAYMIKQINKSGGNIDKIYFAPDLASSTNELRKPKTGMALQAKEDFNEIDFKKSIMVGDSHTDMEFGKKMGMKTIFINPEMNGKYDKSFEKLIFFSKSIQ